MLYNTFCKFILSSEMACHALLLCRSFLRLRHLEPLGELGGVEAQVA